jgi:hypothetical protein
MNRLNQHTQIVTENLAEYLIELSDIALTAHRIAELAFDHAKGGLDIGPLVIMR